MRNLNLNLSVYVIIDPQVCNGLPVDEVALAALKGGATMIQLRNKVACPAVVLEQARAIQAVIADFEASFIINDHVELAVEVNADGVHIGQDDMSVAEARSIIGENKILGLTAYTNAHYDNVDAQIVDYVGTGPVYPTLTKPDKLVLGVEGFAELVKRASVPVVGIGGITPDNAGEVIRIGADGVAMMRSVTHAPDPRQATADFVRSVNEARKVSKV